MQKLSCLFSVEVVAAEGLPASMNGLCLSVCVSKKKTRDCMPSRVSQGTTDFEETLFTLSHVYYTPGSGTHMAVSDLRFQIMEKDGSIGIYTHAEGDKSGKDETPFEVSPLDVDGGVDVLNSAVTVEEWVGGGMDSEGVMVAVLVQLRDPIRQYEGVGGPMVVLVHAGPCTNKGEEGEVRYKVSSLQVGVMKVRSGGARIGWDAEKQRLTALQWLVAYEMGKKREAQPEKEALRAGWRRPPEKKPTIEWSLAIEATTGKDEASTTEKVVTHFRTAMVGNTLGANDGGIGVRAPRRLMKRKEKAARHCRVLVPEKGEAMIEQMPVRNQKESNDQEMPALMKESVGETSHSETLRMSRSEKEKLRLPEREPRKQSLMLEVQVYNTKAYLISGVDPKMKSLISKSSEREGEHYHCPMILPTARRQGIGIRTIGRRLRKRNTKERPSVNDGGIRKKKGRESHCG
ncbi:hypothetical protein SASPL_134578 [Salvia splendens]|uniref:C2 NT-type domain-containing protein n=1 Tax=Salvia splendens TaxID=180675 RepID=A0A8X8WWM3_SALSN|nr:hypothetical protein SASPL_134578 [Salvia splendens]